MPPRTLWLLSDGKAGHETPLIGVADAIGGRYELRVVTPRRIFAALAPWGPIDPRDRNADGVLEGPFPDICMASGRRTVPYLRALKARSPDTFCVYFKDPRTQRSGADMLVTMFHDGMTGDNVFSTRTSPHRIGSEDIRAARASPLPELAALRAPRVAVLIGGNSRHHKFSENNIQDFLAHLNSLRRNGASLMITISRRTPLSLQDAIVALETDENVVVWDGQGNNPLVQYLALSDAVVVTSDSINMVGEAASTGKPIHLFHPSGSHVKFDIFLKELATFATIKSFDGELGGIDYDPIDSTAGIANEIISRHRTFLQSAP